MTVLLEKIMAEVSRLPEADQDAVTARLLETLTDFEREKQNKQQPRPQFGSARGLITLAPDFDDPIEGSEEEL